MEGAPNELSVYVNEGYWRGNSTNIRRYTLRIDGFVAVTAPMAGGGIVTRPLVFEGGRLTLNFSTSAAGASAWRYRMRRELPWKDSASTTVP